jgi:hypothetical protein
VKEDGTSYFNSSLARKGNDNISSLEFRIADEKADYLTKEISNVGANVENYLMKKTYKVFKQKKTQLEKAASDYNKNKQAILNIASSTHPSCCLKGRCQMVCSYIHTSVREFSNR